MLLFAFQLWIGGHPGDLYMLIHTICHLKSLFISHIHRIYFVDAELWKTSIFFIPSPLLLPQVAIKKNTVSCLDVIFKVFHQLLKSSLFFCASILVWCTEHCEFLCLPLLQTVDCLSGFHLMFKLLFEFLPGVHCVFLGHQGSWSWS